jgi:polyisoprenoid-binding protein YceI
MPAMTTTTYELDPVHTHLSFSVRHMMVSHQRGQFTGVTGTMALDRANLAGSHIEVSVDVTTINTNNADRDNHLRSGDFFDVANHPKMTFVSKTVEAGGGDELVVTGDLTIRGNTHSVVLKAEPISEESKDPYGNIRVGTSVTGKISRKQFGLVWNALLETGGVAVADDVKLMLDVQFTRK